MKTEMAAGTLELVIEQRRGSLRCPECGTKEVIAKGHTRRAFRTVGIGSKPVRIILPVPRVASYHAPQEWEDWSDWLAAGSYGRSRWRLAPLIMGLVFGGGRRVSRWHSPGLVRPASLPDCEFRPGWWRLSVECGPFALARGARDGDGHGPFSKIRLSAWEIGAP